MLRRRAVCVLGCRTGCAAFVRRAHVGASAFFEHQADVVVATGGRAWGGIVEADDLARIVIERGVPPTAVFRERCSLDTRDNARFTAALLARHGIDDVIVVTCDWHIPRAARLFRAAGLNVTEVGVPWPHAGPAARLYYRVREVLTTWRDRGRAVRIA